MVLSRRRLTKWLVTAPALATLVPVSNAQSERLTFRVPFHTVSGMILLDAVVNGKPVSLLLDTGASATSISTKALGLTAGEIRLRGMRSATEVGVESDYIVREVDLRLAECRWLNRRVLVMDLSGVNNRLGMKIDGFIGQDLLRGFRAVRIDYKNQAVELEE